MKITNELIESAKDFANKINAQFVSIEKTNTSKSYLKLLMKTINLNLLNSAVTQKATHLLKLLATVLLTNAKILSKNGTPLNKPWNWQSLKLLDNIK